MTATPHDRRFTAYEEVTTFVNKFAFSDNNCDFLGPE